MVFAVRLYKYDLSKGLAAQLSPFLLNTKIDAIWHTSIVVHDSEYFFDGSGIENSRPGTTRFQTPDSIENMGNTSLTRDEINEIVQSLNQFKYM
ncbi:MAG: Desumoylating isopeptidase 1 [Paramarteilia canceri]